MDFKNWIDTVFNDDWYIYIKRLSANDTGASGGHQSGVYIPKPVMAILFPSLTNSTANPDAMIKAVVESDSVPEQDLRVVYYNQGTRDEKRITRWKKGVEYTPLQDREKTGAISVFAFNFSSNSDASFLRAWVCKGVDEEDYLESLVGEIDPKGSYFSRGGKSEIIPSSENIKEGVWPDQWKTEFPSGAEIISHLMTKKSNFIKSPDKRIIVRREDEFSLFKLIERYHALPLISGGFDCVEEFAYVANSILNRRKSRSGRSLEIHLENIFLEEGLRHYGVQCSTEGKKKPDFLFPDCSAYHADDFPQEKLQMLAVKTTVKDRWRQILNEANKIESPYLFTLQQGVSENQFSEMKDAKVRLVVPNEYHRCYPESVRKGLYSLNNFIGEMKNLYS